MQASKLPPVLRQLKSQSRRLRAITTMTGWLHSISNLVASLIININLPNIVEDITLDIACARNLFAHAGYLVSKIAHHIQNIM
jgi:hypothetical protein